MTQQDYTHWTLVVDRSGSMNRVKDDAQGGINAAFKAQRALPGRLTVSLVQFDNEIETLGRMVDITTVPDYTLSPRGETALFDAVARAIVQTGEDLASLDEDKRPANVLVQIVTDGQNNASREFTLEQVRDMIAEQKDQYDWTFAFIGAGDNAWVGRDLGTQAVSSYADTPGGTKAAYATSSASLAGLRSSGTYQMPERIPDPDQK